MKKIINVIILFLVVPLLAGLCVATLFPSSAEARKGGSYAICDADGINTVDEFANSNSDNVQDVLDDLDDAIEGNKSGTSRFTEGETRNSFVAGHAAPDVSNGGTGLARYWETSGTTAYTITDFVDAVGGDHSEFSDGDWFVLRVDDAYTTIDFSANANIEGNANIDFTGSASQIVHILFVYDGTAWNAVNLTAGFSDPTTQAISAYKLEGEADALSDDTYTGITIGGLNAGENINQWDVVYLESGDTEYKQADADADEWPARGLAVSSGTDGNELVILVQGTARNDAWNWSKSGTTLFLSDTPGGITETAPAGAGDCIQIIGWTLSDDEAYFNFSGHYVRKE